LHDLDFLEKDDERLLEKRRVFENELKEAEEAESLAIRAVEKVADTLEEHQFAYIDGAEFPKGFFFAFKCVAFLFWYDFNQYYIR